ncbi:hypothetical protein [Schaedlerella sp.]|uniref:hypothetical protein n=1 Tax=Schaedlerella sp. TaxID=2676057 RepID=UPI003744ED63
MRITALTTPQEVSEKTKNVMNMDAIPNMLLKNVGRSNGFVSEKRLSVLAESHLRKTRTGIGNCLM